MFNDPRPPSASHPGNHRPSVVALGAVTCLALGWLLAGQGHAQPWLTGAGRFRVAVTLEAVDYERVNKPVDHFLNFTALLHSLGQEGMILDDSLRVVEVDAAGTVIDDATPFQYDAFSDTSGTVIFLMTETTPAHAQRYYHIYFDTHGVFEPLSVDPWIELEHDVIDEEQLAYRITTPAATYLYQKDAGGFSSLLDVDGNDWLNFHPWGGSDGIYRGIPNLVHPDNIFHPGHANCTSAIVHAGPLKVTIHTVSNNGQWASLWEIYPSDARFTILQAARKPYWFLYEGTPGGALDLDTDFCVRSTGARTPMTQAWTGDIPAPEWVYFEDAGLDRYLYFVHHEDDTETDSFYQMQQNMTVLGFGRSGLNKYLDGAPKHFTIGLADNAAFDAASATIEAAYQAVTVVASDLSARPDFDGDSRVDENDLALFMEHWLEAAPSPHDLTDDGIVDLDDLLVLLDYYNPDAREPSSLQGRWIDKNDVAGVLHDASPYGRHGFIHGVAPTSAGTPARILEFDGSGDHVEIKGYSGVPGTQARTIAAWIKTEATDYVDILCWGTDEPGAAWKMLLTRGSRKEVAGALRIDVGDGYATGASRLNDGQWHHIAVVLPESEAPTTGDILLYVDGQAEAISHVSDALINTAVGLDVTLGNCPIDPHTSFEGALDDLRIYDRASGATEIRKLAATIPSE